MATTASASRLQSFRVSTANASDHSIPAINPITEDVAVIYSEGASPSTIKVAIYKRIADTIYGKPQWNRSQIITLATPAGALTPSGGASPSCAHPWICPIEDGFAAFWERKDTTIAVTTMTVGGMQIEMAKLKADPNGGGGYVKYASETAGKGFVLDNTLIAGVAGGTPRAAWNGVGNLVAVVFGHQLTDSLAVDDHQRTWDVRAAYLDFSADGKPSLISGGNRMGGSVSDATDGGFAAGATQTWLVNAVDLDDDEDTPAFAGGGGLPHCVFDIRGDLAVAYEARNGKAGTGGIVLKLFKGPFRASGLDTAAIYTNTTDFGATATWAAHRPILAQRSAAQAGVPLAGTNYPPLLLIYGNVDPSGVTADTALAKTVTFPLNGAAPTVAAVTIPVNQNYDATTDDQTLPTCVESSFFSAFMVQERLVQTAGGDGYKFKIVHTDATGEIFWSDKIARPQRPNLQACVVRSGLKIAALTYEGQNASGSGSENIYMTMFQFA